MCLNMKEKIRYLASSNDSSALPLRPFWLQWGNLSTSDNSSISSSSHHTRQSSLQHPVSHHTNCYDQSTVSSSPLTCLWLSTTCNEHSRLSAYTKYDCRLPSLTMYAINTEKLNICADILIHFTLLIFLIFEIASDSWCRPREVSDVANHRNVPTSETTFVIASANSLNDIFPSLPP